MFERTVSLIRQLVGRNEPSDSLTADERRAWPRYPTDMEIVCWPVGKGRDAEFKARVRNVSLGGISLLVPRAFAEGDLLNVDLPSSNPEKCCTVLACVVFVKQE